MECRDAPARRSGRPSRRRCLPRGWGTSLTRAASPRSCPPRRRRRPGPSSPRPPSCGGRRRGPGGCGSGGRSRPDKARHRGATCGRRPPTGSADREASRASRRLEFRLERRVVAEALVAPRVVVGAGDGAQLGRAEEVVEPPAPGVAGGPPPCPAGLPCAVAVERPEGVLEAKVPEAGDDTALGLVPLVPAL